MINYVKGQPAFESRPWNENYQVMPNEEEPRATED